MNTDRQFLARLHEGIDHAERKRRRGSVRTAMLLGVMALATFGWYARRDNQEDIAVRPLPPASRLVHNPIASMLLEAARLRLDGFGDRSAAAPRLRILIRDYPRTREAALARALLQGESS